MKNKYQYIYIYILYICMYVYTDGYFGEVLVRSLQKNTSAISLQHNWRKKEGGGLWLTQGADGFVFLERKKR